MSLKKTNSKLIAALLSVIMVVAFMPQMAFAEEVLDAQSEVIDSTEASTTLEAESNVQESTPEKEPVEAIEAKGEVEDEFRLNSDNFQTTDGLYLSVMGVNGANISSGMIANISEATVYTVLTNALTAANISHDITPEKINSINGIGPATTGGDKPAWFFAINQNLAKESIGTAKVHNGDILRVFYVKNVDKAKLGYVDPIGVAGNYFAKHILEEKDASFIYLNQDDSFWLQLFGKSLNFNDLSLERETNPKAEIMDASGTISGELILNDKGPEDVEGFGLPYIFPKGKQPAGNFIKMTKPSNDYEFIPGYIKVVERPETLGTSNFLGVYSNWIEEARNALAEQDFLENTTETFFYEALDSSDYVVKNAWVATAHRDIYNNDIKLSGLNFKNQQGEYLDMVQKEDPLNGFNPYRNSYSLGNTPDNMTLHYSCLGDKLSVSVTVPDGVTYDATTRNISNLQGKKGEISIVVENSEIYKDNTYTVSFNNEVSGQPQFAAYLPGYGQFTNERPNEGYWGDAYLAGNTSRKNMVNNMVQTGVSLGSFGGFAVFDFGPDGISNSPSNKYGVDFIVYGNAFNGNAEPGGVQISADGNNWYNIAGSRHYSDDTIWNYTVEHKNPNAGDDENTGVNDGTAYETKYFYNFKAQARPNASIAEGTGKIEYNSWHYHSWYPLYGNYFKERNGETPLANLELTNKFATYTPRSENNPSELKLKGTKINFTSMSAADYTFGYCDVHPNGNTPGTPENPYAATQTSKGGDGIDISWAVDANGTPVKLNKIRYVRIYTGVMNDNPPFGETSTEVCGIYKVSDTGTGAAVASLKIENNENLDTVNISDMGVSMVDEGTYTVSSDSDYVYINGVRVTDAGSGHELELEAGQIVQIITQNGTESPYVTVIKCKVIKCN